MAETLKDAICLIAVTPADVQRLNYKPCRIEQDKNDEDPPESRYLEETSPLLCKRIYLKLLNTKREQWAHSQSEETAGIRNQIFKTKMLFGLLNNCASHTGQRAFMVSHSRGHSCSICAVKCCHFIYLIPPSTAGAHQVKHDLWWCEWAGTIKSKPLRCKDRSGGAGLSGGRLKNPQWERTKGKNNRPPRMQNNCAAAEMVQKIKHARQARYKRGKHSVLKATWLQHVETSLFQRHQFKMTAIKQDMLHSS